MTTKKRQTTPVKKTGSDNANQEEIVKTTNDNKIDQDYPGFPHGHSNENIINPKSRKDKKTADINNEDGEKMNRKEIDEARSDGSGGAFSATEEVKE